MVAALLLVSCGVSAQGPAGPPKTAKPEAQPWEYSFTFDGYFVPDDLNYGSPVFTADRAALHLEARYNYENLATGSLWAGYNFHWGTNVEFALTPMLGAVFGRTNGISPGCEASLTYKKIELSVSNEYVITPGNTANNFYYSWPQITYSATEWLRVGAVAQHTKTYHTPVSVERGFLVGFHHDKWETTAYIFNPGITTPTVVLEFGVSF